MCRHDARRPFRRPRFNGLDDLVMVVQTAHQILVGKHRIGPHHHAHIQRRGHQRGQTRRARGVHDGAVKRLVRLGQPLIRRLVTRWGVFLHGRMDTP